MSKFFNKEEAMTILKKYNKNESLLSHALAVSGVMKHFAKIYNEDESKWEVVGLLHDLDYEMYPDQHCKKVVEILEDLDADESLIRAIVSHGYELCTDVEPITNMEKVLYTIDELTGLITACAYMRPSKSVLDLEYKSVDKKFKQKSFAQGVNRDVIQNGANMLQTDLKTIIEQTILGMREISNEIGLKGTL